MGGFCLWIEISGVLSRLGIGIVAIQTSSGVQGTTIRTDEYHLLPILRGLGYELNVTDIKVAALGYGARGHCFATVTNQSAGAHQTPATLASCCVCCTAFDP